MDEDLWGHGRAPPKPDVPSPSHDDGKAFKRPTNKRETQEDKSPGQGESPQDQPPLEPDLEEMAEIIISEGNESDITIEEPQGSSTPRSGLAQSQKRHLEDQSPHPSPPKKRATRGEEKSTPQREVAMPTGVKEDDLLPKRYEIFTMDNHWVQWVRCSLLGLETGSTPSKEDIDTSERFVPQAAVSELEPPDVIMDLWLPILQEQGLLVECQKEQKSLTREGRFPSELRIKWPFKAYFEDKSCQMVQGNKCKRDVSRSTVNWTLL